MYRRLTAPDVGIVKTGQIVVDKRGAMQKLDRDRGSIGERRIISAAGSGDGQRQSGADPRPARKYGMMDRL
jgi:hypothetical protein